MMPAWNSEDLLITAQRADNRVVGTIHYGYTVSLFEIEANLDYLKERVLEPVAKGLGRGRLSSCYRSPEVNRLVGGASNSAHTVGLAADWIPVVSFSEAVHWLAGQDLPLDRVILELRDGAKWLHLQAFERHAAWRPIQWFCSPKAGVYQRTTPVDLASRAS